jgi:uroporphyrinogen-III decarboxylase
MSDNNSPQGPPPLPDNWSGMNGDEKFDYLSKAWASPEGKPFASDEIAEKYQRRAQRWLDVATLKKPDRVPEYLITNEIITSWAGIKPADTFYQPEKAAQSAIKFHEDFEAPYSALGFALSGKALELLNYQLVRWPGSSLSNGLADEIQYQYIEKEFMAEEDYDDLIANPDGYLLRKYMPTICQGVKGLEMWPNLLNLVEIVSVTPMMMSLAVGPLRQAIDTLLKAADHSFAHMQAFFKAGGEIMSRFGAPSGMGGFTKAPFDILGDTLRGTRAIMMDMYRRPDKVVAACEALVPVAIQQGVQACMATRVPFVFMPLHKGADGFMSNEQFEKFYWPSYKATMLGLIDNGLIPLSFVEGGYNQRLDIIAESGMPAGKSMWLFDRTDMKAAKEKMGSFACIGGNVPNSLFTTSTPDKMEEYCKDLIDTVGQDGGFFLAPGAVIDQTKPENLRAFLGCAKKYGQY